MFSHRTQQPLLKVQCQWISKMVRLTDRTLGAKTQPNTCTQPLHVHHCLISSCLNVCGPFTDCKGNKSLHMSVCVYLVPGLQTRAATTVAAGWCSLWASRHLPQTRWARSESAGEKEKEEEKKNINTLMCMIILINNCKKSWYNLYMIRSTVAEVWVVFYTHIIVFWMNTTSQILVTPAPGNDTLYFKNNIISY